MIDFLKVDSSKPVIEDLVCKIQSALARNEHVLWLVSGGSVVPVEVAAMQRLSASNCEKLTIMQVDERYGAVGHVDSNWQKLLDAGFNTGNAKCSPVLDGGSFENTISRYNSRVIDALNANDFRIGVFGLGADGHTAGMLPGSVAATEADKYVVGYQGPDFLRITITAQVVAKLDVVIACTTGKEKVVALKNLQKQLAVSDQPAQILKQAKNVYMYNDYMEGTA